MSALVAKARHGLLLVLTTGDRLLLAGLGSWVYARRKVREKIAYNNDAAIAILTKKREVAVAIPETALRELETAELERLRSLEDKAKTNVVGITLAFSLIGGAVTFWRDGDPIVQTASEYSAVLLYSVAVGGVFFVLSGLLALAALGVGMVYRLTPEDYLDTEERRAKLRLYYLEQNQLTTLLRSNALSVSFGAMRNGVLTIAFGVLFVIWHMLNNAP